MSTTNALALPDPDDVQRGLAELERHVAGHAPTTLVPAVPAPAVEVERADLGETKRVRLLRAEVAEAHALADLQDDETPLLLDTARVRKMRMKAHEAARLHQLGQDPAMRAYQASRMRRVLVAAGMASLTLALAWSTAGVHAFAAEGASKGSPAWVFAWLVEPFLSLALLVVVGAKAYLGTRGQPIKSAVLTRIEWLFLGLTLGMNAWPYLPWSVEDFSVSRLVLHILGPIIAVAIVTALPIILAAFSTLDHGRVSTGGTPPKYRENAAGEYPHKYSEYTLALIARARRLIEAGKLPAEPSIHKVREALACGTDNARVVSEAFKGGAS